MINKSLYNYMIEDYAHIGIVPWKIKAQSCILDNANLEIYLYL